MARILKRTVVVVDTPQTRRVYHHRCEHCDNLVNGLCGGHKVPRALKLTGTSGAVKARQRIEQTIALTAAQALLDAGYSLGVNDGEETTIHHSRDLDAIQAALFTTDEDWLLVYEDPKGIGSKSDWWVHFVYGNDGWDVISDYCVALDDVLGDGTVVQKLIDHAEAWGVVPDLYTR